MKRSRIATRNVLQHNDVPSCSSWLGKKCSSTSNSANDSVDKGYQAWLEKYKFSKSKCSLKEKLNSLRQLAPLEDDNKHHTDSDTNEDVRDDERNVENDSDTQLSMRDSRKKRRRRVKIDDSDESAGEGVISLLDEDDDVQTNGKEDKLTCSRKTRESGERKKRPKLISLCEEENLIDEEDDNDLALVNPSGSPSDNNERSSELGSAEEVGPLSYAKTDYKDVRTYRKFRLVSFFNEAPVEEIARAPRCNATVASIICDQRPYQSYNDMKEQFEETKGLTVTILEKALGLLSVEDELEGLLNQCSLLSEELDLVIPDILSGQKVLVRHPTLINAELQLKDYQQIGLNWLIALHERQLSLVLADEMGLGKTIQVIAFLAHLQEMDPDPTKPHLIVVPASTIDNWLAELNRWCPALEVVAYYGSQADREALRRRLTTSSKLRMAADVIVTTYSVVTSQKEDKAERRILLTGTPLQNNLLELISLMNFVMPDLFQEHAQDLQSMLKLFQSVLDGLLPPKVAKEVMCPMTAQQCELYESLVAECVAESKSDSSVRINWIMKMRKAANHPLLFRRFYDEEKLAAMTQFLMGEPEQQGSNPDYVFEDLSFMSDFEIHLLCKQYTTLKRYCLPNELIINSGKFRELDKHIPMIRKGRKALIFSQFTMMLDILEAFLQIRGWKYVRLDGSTPVTDRLTLIDSFNTDESIALFLLSTKAGGLGINLTSANTIIMHDIDFNPYNDKQAEDRCHRVGQQLDVKVIKLISKNTVEERIYELAQKKLCLEQQVMVDKDSELDGRDVDYLLQNVCTEGQRNLP